MQMKKIKWLLTLLAGASMLAFVQIVHAENVDFSVAANLPANQVDTQNSYFDLWMKPKQVQKLTLTVSNQSTETKTVTVSPNTATTNQNGVIDYSHHDVKPDQSQKISVQKLISGPKKIDIPAKSQQQISYQLKMPAKSFDGVLLGGFYVTAQPNKVTSTHQKAGVSLNNQFAYVIGLQLRENRKTIKPVVKLGKITPKTINLYPAVEADIHNPTGTILHNLTVQTKISQNGKILHEAVKKGVSMAPNSSFQYPISWDRQALTPGHYHLDTTVKDEIGHQWHFKRAFAVTSHQARSVMSRVQAPVSAVKSTPNYWWLATIPVALIAAGIAYMIGRKSTKK